MFFLNVVADDVQFMPERAHLGDAGADLRSTEDLIIHPKEVKLVNTGIKLEIPYGYVGYLVSRSGHGKYPVSLANCVGVIDHQYRGYIMARLENRSAEDFIIKRGDRICQLIISPVVLPEFKKVSVLTTTTRGDSGFGSTGTA
jgi:dUTP pyrophosphatase